MSSSRTAQVEVRKSPLGVPITIVFRFYIINQFIACSCSIPIIAPLDQ